VVTVPLVVVLRSAVAAVSSATMIAAILPSTIAVTVVAVRTSAANASTTVITVAAILPSANAAVPSSVSSVTVYTTEAIWIRAHIANVVLVAQDITAAYVIRAIHSPATAVSPVTVVAEFILKGVPVTLASASAPTTITIVTAVV
jgi:hypothetical protein